MFCRRDLHWGNVLVRPTTAKKGSFLLDGEVHSLETKGVLVSIIDYSLSRLEIGQEHFSSVSQILSLWWTMATNGKHVCSPHTSTASLQTTWPCPATSLQTRSCSWARGIISLTSTEWWERRTGQCVNKWTRDKASLVWDSHMQKNEVFFVWTPQETPI